MRWLGFVSMAAALVMGCGLPQDAGVVMGCFGLVNESIPGPDVFSTEVVTNTYFGGCDPSDPGMQIIERATEVAAADQTIMTARCNEDCNARLEAYAAAHPEVTLPLSCQTLFAIPCEGLRSNVTSDAILQGGGPADTRFLLSGTVTVTVDGESRAVPAAGIVDGTLATSCQGVPESCPLTLSRLDVLGLESFPMGGVQVDSVHIQNQGLAVGSKSGGQIVIGAEAIEAEVNAMVGGALRAFHVRNVVPVQAGGDPTLEQFLSSLDIMMTQGNVSVHIDMTGTPVGRRPVAAFTPQTTLYECPSSPCTVQLTSAASDPDDDLQGLSWLVDGVPQLGVASAAPETIDLVVPAGPHTVSLVATDSRGAASAASLAINVVDAAPAVPTGLTVGVFDRRRVTMRLSWTAPDDSGARVAGYQVRYAKVPITAANFDDASVTTAVTYTGTPSAPMQIDGIDVSGLYVENNYHFAVAATDASGNRSAIATAVPEASCACGSDCCVAHLNVRTLTGAGGGAEQFGFQFDSGDVDKGAGTPGPSFSDLVVGSFAGKRAYLYLGSAGTTPSVPSVSFTGDATTTASFGRGVAIIGDIDADGFADVAIADRGTPSRIYIYKGRTSWPMTVSNADADYVVSVDATYNGSIFGGSMARLGDFNGDGVDDFAVGASLFGGTSQVGRAVVVLGSASFASFSLPNTTNTIVIDGPANLSMPQFGYRVLGLGHFYSVTTGTTLIVSAPGNVVAPSGFEGRIYAFHGQAAGGAPIPAASADHMIVGPSGNNRIGIALANLGPILGPLPSLGSGNPVDRVTTPNGSTYVFNGTSATGPFASGVAVHQSGSAKNGIAVIGGGISGVDQSYSLIGDTTPDLVVVAQTTPSFIIVDGRTLAGAASPVDASVAGSVTIPVPTGWGNTHEAAGRLIPDLDGDGYADFAISNALGAVPGNVVVYW